MSDYQLTSLYILTKESNIKVIMQEMTTLSNISWFSKNSPTQYHRKCIENSKENLQTDAARVFKVNRYDTTNLLLASFMIINLPSYTAIRSDVVGSLTRVLYCGNLFSIVARNYKNKKKKNAVSSCFSWCLNISFMNWI